MQQTANPIHLTLNDVKQHFDHWRATRTKRGKIPDYLWDKVKTLIDKYSLTAITQALNINSNQMREHLDLDNKVKFVEAVFDASQAQSNHQNKLRLAKDKKISIECE